MEALLAVVINMGLIQVPDIESYWSTNWISSIPFFSHLFARDRFEQIFWMLHVSRGDPGSEEKRIDKVKIILDLLVANFKKCFAPERNLSVDETMVGFKGRFGPKQYMPNKPTKYGIKTFTLADSKQGYVLDILVYTGGDTLDCASAEHSNLPQPARVVLHLLRDYLDKGHRIFTDRYYTSIPLAQALSHRSTGFTGTCMKNRVGLPDEIRAKSFRLRDDEVQAYRSDDMLVVGWRAAKKKKPVVMLSTECSAASIDVRSRATGNILSKPVVINEYNYSMNGVDKADQFTVYYSFIRRSKKWWRKLFFWLVEVAIVNSYILYRLSTQSPLTHLQYRRRLVDALASHHRITAPPRPHAGRPHACPLNPTGGDPARLNKQPHYLGKRELQDCLVCSNRPAGKRRRSKFYCKSCTSHPALCPTECFERYHTLDRFRV